MRGLRRHGDERGLDAKRRGLIHRYMTDVDEPAESGLETAPPEQTEESELSAAVTEISAAPLEEVEQPTGSAAAVEAEAPADQAPAEAVLRLLPPVPDRQVAFDVARRTLEQVTQLCAQMDRVRVECNRRRERLAAAVPR
jgi:hypothetical protein